MQNACLIIPTHNSSPSIPSGKPTFSSHFAICQFEKTDALIPVIREYFAINWPWQSLEQKEKFMDQDLEICTMLFFPNALHDLMEHTAMIMDLFFLMNDTLDYWSHAEVTCLVLTDFGVEMVAFPG